MADDGAGEAELRRELVKACKVLYAANAAVDGLGGHLSVRVGEDRILIKPARELVEPCPRRSHLHRL